MHNVVRGNSHKPEGSSGGLFVPQITKMDEMNKYKLYWQVLRKTIFSKKIKRTDSLINKEYSSYWNKIRTLTGVDSKTRFVLENGEVKLFSEAERARKRIQRFNEIFCSLQPQNVLEIGSGAGHNILALVALHPEIHSWIGLELTAEGVKTANLFLKNPPLETLTYITGQNSKIIKERIALANIKFIQGSMTDLPFEDSSIDLIFSSAAIEQLPNDCLRAFKEAYRVTAKWGIFHEAFNEGQNWIQRLYRKKRHFMQTSYKTLNKLGFKTLVFEPQFANKIKHTDCLLVCQKKV